MLVTFSIMLSDFFDTMGTIIGVGAQGRLPRRAAAACPRADRVLLVDSLGAVFGGVANSSSNTTYIESAAGVTEGGRTGLVPVVAGALFLRRHVVLAAGRRHPGPGHGAGPHHRRLLHDERASGRSPGTIAEEAIPAFVTMLAMPFTWSITNGIGAGFVTYVTIKVLSGRGGRVHWMLYLAAAAFVVYFLLAVLERHLT